MIKKEVTFITGNEMKFRTAASILEKYGVSLIQKNIETPEIQSENGLDVAVYSARYAAAKLKCAVVKTDVSYEIPALKNFPGPFVKFVNNWLNAEDVLALMAGKKDRSLNIVEYLVYIDEAGAVHTFKTISKCSIASEVREPLKGSAFDKIIVREGYEVPQNMLSRDELDEMLSEQVKIWDGLGRFLSQND